MASFRETPMITLILSKLHIEFEVVKIFCRVFDGLPQLCKFGKLNYLYLHTL